MKWSDDRAALVEALSKVMLVLEDPTKDRKVTAGGRGTYKYATLGSFLGDSRKALAAQGVVLTQGVEERWTIGLSTTLSHSSGQWVETFVPFVGELRDVQAMGSMLSYVRRYSILSILGLAPEDDDDGQAASKPKVQAMPPADKPKPESTGDGFPDRAPPEGQRTAEPLAKELDASKAKPAGAKETDAEKQVRQDAHDGQWERDRPNFMAALSKVEFQYDEVCEFQEWRTSLVSEPTKPPKGKPSTIGRTGRLELLNFLKSDDGASVYARFLSARDARSTA